MKKSILYSLMLSAVVATGCKGDYDDWANPQGFDPEEAQTIAMSVTPCSAIKMADVTEDSLVIFTSSIDMPEGGKLLSYDVKLNDTYSLPVSKEGKAAVEDIKSAVVSLYGKRPDERTMAMSVVGRVLQGNEGFVAKASPADLAVTLVAPVIETGYAVIGTNNGWALDETAAFIHSDKDVYDDPVFTVTVKAPVKEDGTRDDFWLKIAPKSATDSGSWDNVLGCSVDGDESLTGALSVGGQALRMPATDGAKFYKIELDMMDYKYTITPLNFEEYIYLPGNQQKPDGWKPELASSLASHGFDGVYTGYAYLNGSFKFTLARNWDSEYNFDTFKTYTEEFTADGSNINAASGYYRLTADVPNAKLTAEAIEWGLIGDATEGGWDASTKMTLNTEDGTWSVTATLKDGGFKFRANDDWKYNVGGTTDDLTQDGGNINVTAGTYKITLNLNDASHYFFTMEKQ